MWFLSSVGEHVLLQVSITCKRLLTDFTLEWLCSSVRELMSLEISTSIEALIALSALEGSLCGNRIV